MNIRDVLSLAPVIPVLSIRDLTHAVPLAEALCRGGLRTLEVSLGAPALALQVIEALRRSVPAAIVGIGNLTRPTEFAMAQRAGAHFGVSPGLTAELAGAARGVRFPLLPGVLTPGDLIGARLGGFDTVQFFPAAHGGGMAMLQALSTAFPEILFHASGGITQIAAREYLQLPSVISIGGAWVAPRELLDAGDWRAIERLAADASQLRPQRV